MLFFNWYNLIMLIKSLVLPIIFSLANSSFYRAYEYSSYVLTPNGSEVGIVLEESKEYDQDEATEAAYAPKDEFPRLEIIELGSLRYNCFSYAFYKQTLPNYAAIDDEQVKKYWEDLSYIEIKTPKIDDKIVYFDSEGTPLHAGIIKRIDNSNYDLSNIYVYSKWATNGVYGHYANYVPSGYIPSNGYIKFYKLHASNHSYIYKYKDSKKHYTKCDECGYIKNEISHVVSAGSFENGKRYATCLYCGGLTEMGIEISRGSSIKENYDYINGYYFVKETKYIDDILNLSYEDYLNYEI